MGNGADAGPHDLARLVAAPKYDQSIDWGRVVADLAATLPARPVHERRSAVALLADLVHPVGLTRWWPSHDPLVAPILAAVSASATDPDPTVRALAVVGLGRLSARTAVDTVRAATEDSDPRVRRAAAWALGQFVLPGSDIALLRPLLADPDPTVRAHAVYALGDWWNAQVYDVLLPALRDPYPPVRRYALAVWQQRLEATVDSYPPEVAWSALQPLVELIDDPDPEVRVQAIASVGQFVDRRAIAPLYAALDDSVPSVRHAALRELVRLDAVPAALSPLPTLGPDEEVLPAGRTKTLPGALGEAVSRALIAMRSHPHHDLDSALRIPIYQAFGPRLDPRAEHARALVALWSARRVQPIAVLDFDLPAAALARAHDVLTGTLVPPALGGFVYGIWAGDWGYGRAWPGGWGPDAKPYDDAASHATSAALLAACEVAGENFLIELGPARSSLHEQHDAAGEAALAEAGARGNEGVPLDPAKRKHFWEWWLLHAVPRAWQMSE